ncbi:uncharacterized protein EI90DRAFT_3069217 [Cantharellus anzutake]|uniref:uncharacterized protein n=1 Tax=Cantharellus anzutake TaxID=1750568 RepID=UPI0019087825|nr:uncharacterized protein EI90DRAFT_3069217 [Cantharellus anzutake]KAF8326838.1 hypothetical protein EI90DRAFT_3069217 [Cantharellus anzutake]
MKKQIRIPLVIVICSSPTVLCNRRDLTHLLATDTRNTTRTPFLWATPCRVNTWLIYFRWTRIFSRAIRIIAHM